MTHEDLLDRLGSTAATAVHLAVSYHTVENWRMGRYSPPAVTTRLLGILDHLYREAPLVADALVGWVGSDTRTVRERLDALGSPGDAAVLLGVSRATVDGWRSGTTQRVGPVVRLLDVIALVRVLVPGVVDEHRVMAPVARVEGTPATVDRRREHAIASARMFARMCREGGDAAGASQWESQARRLESGG